MSINLGFGGELTKDKSFSTAHNLFRHLAFMVVITQFNFCGIADGVGVGTSVFCGTLVESLWDKRKATLKEIDL